LAAHRRALEYAAGDVNRYVPHIDGLRTIAVLSVFLFHLGVFGVDGGFVGVDIFFVISGYLITNILKTSAEKGTLSLSAFYARRARRLFPAFIITLLACLVTGLFLLSPARLSELARSANYALFSISNLYFYLNSGYFDLDSKHQILLHTWSLAVEEQFYLVWPLLIGLIVKWVPPKRQLVFICAVTAAGALACILATRSNPSLAFYMMPFRAGEFGMGALLCWLHKPIGHSKLTELAVVAGLALIFASIVFINEEIAFPGAVVLGPCIGTALVIRFGAVSYVGSKIVGSAPMAYIGRISYSLYLIHWPLIIYYRQLFGTDLSAGDQIVIFVLVLLAAAASQRYIELPFKEPVRLWPTSARVAAVYASALALCLVAFTHIWHQNGYPGRVPEQIRGISLAIEKEKNRRFEPYAAMCVKRGWASCKELSQDQDNLVILGDSQGIDGFNILQPWLNSVHAVMRTEEACPPMSVRDSEELIKPSFKNYRKCRENTKLISAPGFYADVGFVAISALYEWYTPAHLDHYLSSANIPDGVAILIFGNAPTFKEDLPELIIRHGTLAGLREYVASSLDARIWDSDEELKRVARKHGARFVSKLDAFCNPANKTCKLFYGDDEKLLSYDRRHLSLEAAESMGLQLSRKYKDISSLFDPSMNDVLPITETALTE
jgi:peptidoglycan/LPS O-acetylase OafA/YrhL